MRSKLTCILLLGVLLTSCGTTTEVTVVDDSSDVLPSESSASQKEENITADKFTILRIGESSSIQTMDPLFASNTSELRVNSLIYDGLTQYSEDGSTQGAIAKSWTVTRDSLRYNFTLRDDVFFHNDSRFTSGIGRQVKPQDIVMNFERMASVLVPDNAANMFTSISGFDAFHNEQTFIKIPSNRSINSIEGIRIANDSTIVFQLATKDPHFLEKLAHPYSSIYPKESIPGNNTPIYEPIGTGRYYFAQRRRGDLIIASNDDYFQVQNGPNRIDIIHGKKESDIYQDFAKGTLDALVEIGPGTITQVIDSTGNIDPIFSTVFKIENPSVIKPVTFYYNPASNNPSLRSYLSKQAPSFLYLKKPLGSISILADNNTQDTLRKETAYIAYTKNSDEVFLIDAIAENLSAAGVNVVMNSSYAVTEEISFATMNFTNAQPTLLWNKPIFILSKLNVSGITISHKPWNISFNNAKVSKGN
jgi:ABC-type transport system substrate-binding protein